MQNTGDNDYQNKRGNEKKATETGRRGYKNVMG